MADSAVRTLGRRLGSLLTQIAASTKLVADFQPEIAGKLDALSTRFDRIDNKVDSFGEVLGATSNRLGELEARLAVRTSTDPLEEFFGGIEEGLGTT